MEYNQQFTFCSDIVKQFIDTNISLYNRDLETLFGEKSWLGSFFNCDLTKLVDEQVFNQFVASCSENTSDVPRQHEAILARIKSLYISLVMSVGTEAIAKIKTNCIDGIYSMVKSDKSKNKLKDTDYQRIVSAFNQCPFIVIAALGAPYYSSKRIEFIRSNGSQLKNTIGKVL